MDGWYAERACASGALVFVLQISPAQNVLVSLACFLGQVMGASEGWARSVLMVLEEEGRRGAMWSVGDLPLVEVFLKMAAPVSYTHP